MTSQRRSTKNLRDDRRVAFGGSDRLASYLLAGVLAVTVLSTGSAAQEPASAAGPIRIAVVDLERVFLQSPAGQRLRTELKQLEERVRTQLETHARQIEELERSMAGKSPEEQRVLARRREDEELALRRTRDDAQRQAAKIETERRDEIETLLQPIFAKLQEERDFDLILSKAPGIVIFVKDSFEITDEVLARVGSGP